MFARIEVKDRKEAEAIKRELSKADVRAFVVDLRHARCVSHRPSRERVL